MTVAEVRKALGKIRNLWAQSTPNAPLFICLSLVRDKTIAEFCTEFVYGHHLKRHRKSTQQRLLLPTGAIPAAACEAVGIAGPKGDSADPYPFTPGWRPKEVFADASKWWDRGLQPAATITPAPTITPTVTMPTVTMPTTIAPTTAMPATMPTTIAPTATPAGSRKRKARGRDTICSKKGASS